MPYNSHHRSIANGLILLLLVSVVSTCHSFGIANSASRSRSVELAATVLPDISEVLNGESCVDEGIEILDGPPISLEGEEVVSSFAPPLTYEKYLTMQSKRVPVTIRYSAESGLKPYFLTVAMKIKEAYPDVTFDRIVLPKMQLSDSSGKGHDGVAFEVLVDGKVVVRTPGRKGAYSIDNMHVYVNMHEVEAAILRARKRRRPQTVYGEESSNERLAGLKNKSKKEGAE
eukprot:scaffold6784_cov108-Cylindrotheca_fusiformis.AAC.1